MQKILRIAIAILFIMVLGRPIFAQEKMIAPLPPDSGMSGQLFGQNQWYSVVFRGNGEAIVSLRATFTNTQSANLTSLSFRVPKVEPKDLLAFQVIQQGPCLKYGTTKGEAPAEVRGMPYPVEPNRPCLLYGDPDPYSWYGPATYQKAKVDFSGDTITITLPQPIKPDKLASVLLYYRAFGYVKKDMVGGFHFTFETLKAAEPIQELQVGISTDSDLVLRGAQGEVNYRFEDVTIAAKGMAAEATPVSNARMDTYYQQIGAGDIIKTASNLQALESYTVKGSYANNRLKLYAKELGIGVGVFALVVLAAFVLMRRTLKVNGLSENKSTPAIAMVGLSFLSAVLIVAYTILLVFLTRNLLSFVEYDMNLPITILMLIVSLGVYGILLFGPAIFLGIRFGWGLGLGTAGFTTVWLILALVIYVLVGISGRPVYPIRAMMDNSTQSISYPEPQMETMEGAAPAAE